MMMNRPGMPPSSIRPLGGGMSPSYQASPVGAGSSGVPSPTPGGPPGSVGQLRRPSGSSNTSVASPVTSDRPITPRTPGGSVAGRTTPGRMTPGQPNPSPSPDQQQPQGGFNPQLQQQQQRMMGPNVVQQPGGGGNPNHPGNPAPPDHGWGGLIFGLKGGASGPVIGRPGVGRVLGGWGYFIGLKGGSPVVTSGTTTPVTNPSSSASLVTAIASTASSGMVTTASMSSSSATLSLAASSTTVVKPASNASMNISSTPTSSIIVTQVHFIYNLIFIIRVSLT